MTRRTWRRVNKVGGSGGDGDFFGAVWVVRGSMGGDAIIEGWGRWPSRIPAHEIGRAHV